MAQGNGAGVGVAPNAPITLVCSGIAMRSNVAGFAGVIFTLK
jgi:hypothetical protein